MPGTANFTQTVWPAIQQSFPPKSKFSVDDIPDLAGRVVIVTGAWNPFQALDAFRADVFALGGGNVGIGYETVKVRESFQNVPDTELRPTATLQALLQHGAKVYLAARSKEKAETAIASLKEATGKEAIFLELDLSSLSSVKKAADEFLRKETELHILFNNA